MDNSILQLLADKKRNITQKTKATVNNNNDRTKKIKMQKNELNISNKVECKKNWHLNGNIYFWIWQIRKEIRIESKKCPHCGARFVLNVRRVIFFRVTSHDRSDFWVPFDVWKELVAMRNHSCSSRREAPAVWKASRDLPSRVPRDTRARTTRRAFYSLTFSQTQYLARNLSRLLWLPLLFCLSITCRFINVFISRHDFLFPWTRLQ